LSTDPTKDSNAKAVSTCVEFLTRQSVDKEIADTLNSDKELLAKFQKDLHDIKIETNTKVLLKKELEDYKFTEAEAPITEILDDLL